MRAPTKKQTLLILATLLLPGCSVYYFTRPKEPTYDGKPSPNG